MGGMLIDQYETVGGLSQNVIVVELSTRGTQWIIRDGFPGNGRGERYIHGKSRLGLGEA